MCCLLLTTALALPALAQVAQPDPQTNTEDKNLKQQPSQVNPNEQDTDREKATEPAPQEDDEELPDTAGGLPILALIGSASLIGAALRRWL